MMPVIQFEYHSVSYDDSQETKNAVFQAVLDWFNEHEQYSGEGIAQSDDCQINAAPLLERIADKIIKFDVKWN
jgi:hypothetical protein